MTSFWIHLSAAFQHELRISPCHDRWSTTSPNKRYRFQVHLCSASSLSDEQVPETYLQSTWKHSMSTPGSCAYGFEIRLGLSTPLIRNNKDSSHSQAYVKGHPSPCIFPCQDQLVLHDLAHELRSHEPLEPCCVRTVHDDWKHSLIHGLTFHSLQLHLPCLGPSLQQHETYVTQ